MRSLIAISPKTQWRSTEKKEIYIKRKYRIINFDLKMSIFDELTTSFGKELHTRTEYGTNVRKKFPLSTCQPQSNDHFD